MSPKTVFGVVVIEARQVNLRNKFIYGKLFADVIDFYCVICSYVFIIIILFAHRQKKYAPRSLA